MKEIFHKLPLQSLRSLAASLRDGSLSSGITKYPLQQIAGPNAGELELSLKELQQAGMGPAQIAIVVDIVVQVREKM